MGLRHRRERFHKAKAGVAAIGSHDWKEDIWLSLIVCSMPSENGAIAHMSGSDRGLHG